LIPLTEKSDLSPPSGARISARSSFSALFTFVFTKGGVYRGHDEIDRIAGELRVMHRDFRYQPIAEPEEVGNGGRVRWTEGRPGEAPAVAGTDFIITRDSRIAAIYFFLTSYPDLNWDVVRHARI
jgi:hypothetical protein